MSRFRLRLFLEPTGSSEYYGRRRFWWSVDSRLGVLSLCMSSRPPVPSGTAPHGSSSQTRTCTEREGGTRGEMHQHRFCAQQNNSCVKTTASVFPPVGLDLLCYVLPLQRGRLGGRANASGMSGAEDWVSRGREAGTTGTPPGRSFPRRAGAHRRSPPSSR